MILAHQHDSQENLSKLLDWIRHIKEKNQVSKEMWPVLMVG